MQLKVKLMHDRARMPTYATSGAACFDIYAVMDRPTEIYPQTNLSVSTGLIFDIPEGYVLMIYSRSGHGFCSAIRLGNCVGIIDSDYKKEVKINLTRDNASWMDSFIVNHGDRIAQGMLIAAPQVEFSQVEEIEDTGRGGFGSTGA